MEGTKAPDPEPSAMTAAISGALADLGPDDSEMLGAIVRVARTIMDAAASSIFLLDDETGELVFEAVSGKGENSLVGTRIPADRGIAGLVAATGESIAIDDLAGNPLFARDLAERTAYVPDALMAVPVIHGTEILGVLQVLDPRPVHRSSLSELDLLSMFAAQAGLSLHALRGSRRARRALASSGAEFERLTALVRLLNAMEPAQQAAGLRLLDALSELLATRSGLPD